VDPGSAGPGVAGRTALRVLAVYDSRHGFTERCLELLATESGLDVERWPVGRGVPDWGAFDAVVFGGPVYYGRWAPRVVNLVERHGAALAQHPAVGAFVVSLSPKSAALRYFSVGLPRFLKGKLGHVACFGGAIVLKKLKWWEKILVKKARGLESDASNLDLPAIRALGVWLSANSAQ
jgi:menaquinone-dependent protoporphyrinogen IX oxidase